MQTNLICEDEHNLQMIYRLLYFKRHDHYTIITKFNKIIDLPGDQLVHHLDHLQDNKETNKISIT